MADTTRIYPNCVRQSRQREMPSSVAIATTDKDTIQVATVKLDGLYINIMKSVMQ